MYEYNLLHKAVFFRSYEVVKLLIQNNADLYATSQSGASVLLSRPRFLWQYEIKWTKQCSVLLDKIIPK